MNGLQVLAAKIVDPDWPLGHANVPKKIVALDPKKKQSNVMKSHAQQKAFGPIGMNGARAPEHVAHLASRSAKDIVMDMDVPDKVSRFGDVIEK